MKWRTSIINVNLAIFVVGFMFATMLGCIIDKSFDHIFLKLIANAILAILVASFISKSIRVYTDEHRIEYSFLWIKQAMKWDEIKDYGRALGVLRLVHKDDKNYIDIPLVWIKERKALFKFIKNRLQ